jgi:DNA-binding HxlR family transcriptional regulator
VDAILLLDGEVALVRFPKLIRGYPDKAGMHVHEGRHCWELLDLEAPVSAICISVGQRSTGCHSSNWNCCFEICTCAADRPEQTGRMNGYAQFCPIALASEVVAERWTPLILREVVMAGARHFSEIARGVGPISQSLLAERLRRLEAAGIVERRANRLGRGWEYHPTPAGMELEPVLEALAIWAQGWIDIRREDCDPAYVMAAIHGNLRLDRFPPDAPVIRFDFSGEDRTYWLILDRRRPELCFHDPGREVGLTLTVDREAMARIVMGRLRLGDAMETGRVTMTGMPALIRSLPDWLGLSRWAPYARELTPLAG